MKGSPAKALLLDISHGCDFNELLDTRPTNRVTGIGIWEYPPVKQVGRVLIYFTVGARMAKPI